MNILDPDELHRTIKLELDEGRAQTFDGAREIVTRYVLQIDVGSGIVESETRQAMLLTAVNAGCRAFIGGVRVRLLDNGLMCVRWSEKKDVVASVESFGGEIVESIDHDHPTIVIGNVTEPPPGCIVLYCTWEGWSGGIVEQQERRLRETQEFTLAGILSAALGVSEAFQHLRGCPVSGRRSAGLSLWKPECNWDSEAAYGEPCLYLPKRLWLIGLGHLGQAYAWVLGLLPYPKPADVDIILQDYDAIVKANKSTGMLSDDSSVGLRKSRVVAGCLEAQSFRTTITERPFDCSTLRRGDEPGVALVGVHDTTTRRLLDEAGFDLVIDAGLGGNSQNYLDILIHSFPSGIKAADAWPERSNTLASSFIRQPAYLDLQQRLRKSTELSDGEIECGIIELAGRSAGAAFVGCVAATLVLSEILRILAGGPRFEVISLSLRSPHIPQVASNTIQAPQVNPGFVLARPI